MVDLLVAWGVTQAVGFVFKPILEDLAKDAAKDWAKDLFKDSLKNVIRLPEKEPLDIAAGKALKEFLQLIQDELEEAELTDEQLKDYIKPLKQFIKDKSVKEILGSAFKDECKSLDTKTLAKIWYQLNLSSLPEDFNWQRIGKKYLKKAKAIVRDSDDLRVILDSQNIEAIQENTKELTGIVPEFDLARYQEGLQEKYGNLNLDSLDTSIYDYRERLKVWQVFVAQNVKECQEYLPQVYEIPKEHQKRLKNSNELEAEVDSKVWERYKRAYYRQPICSVLDIVNDSATYPYIVILGDPGSGKSTLLQYIALNWARTPINNVIELPIPLLIELRSYKRDRISGQCNNFLEFFHKGNIICHLNQHQLAQKLKAGKVLVMFDGLDEVFDPAQREEVITDIHRFTNDYPNVRVIVTSRIIGYKPRQLKDAQFRHFLLQDLESEQIEDFLYRWHELTFTDEADKLRKRERLQQAIKTSKAIGELAGNPLLLTMMAILNRNQELPRDRPELYNQASRLLLHQWDVEQKLLEDSRVDSLTIDYKDKQAMLRQVAYYMQAADQGLSGNLISTDDLEKILIGYLKSIEVSNTRMVARLLIEQLRSRNFILCFLGADSYGFVHRTFLEYFCACEFVERFGKRGSIGGLTLEELKSEAFGKHWHDESWHEVLRLIMGMIDTSFAGEIIEHLVSQNGEKEKFINILLGAKCFSEVRNRNALTAVDAKLLKHLRDLSKFEHSRRVQKEAIQALARIWKDFSETLPWLKSCVQFDADPNVRTVVMQELARDWKDDPETLSIIKTRAESDEYLLVRQAALQEVAKGWKDNPNTLSWLKTRAQSDESSVVRLEAVREVAKGWRDDCNTRPWLKTRVQFDKSLAVQQEAAKELAKAWKDEPGIFELLYHRAVNVSSQNEFFFGDSPRQAALEVIIEYYPDHLQTFPLLHNLAENDPDEQVRWFVMQELAKGWKDELGVFELLYNRAINALSEHRNYLFGYLQENNPRQLALEIIIKQYPDHPQTLPLLRDRAENDPDEKMRKFANYKLAELEKKNNLKNHE
ncbi:MAG: HEAT repeat domain-containing protein [Coleofasciculaceae cyanobacterium]